MRTNISSWAFLLFCSCGTKEYAPKNYVSFVESPANGLCRKLSISGWEYDMQYRPYDYTVLQESRNGMSDSMKKIRFDQLKGTAWFSIRFRKENSDQSPLRVGVHSLDEYQQRYVYYMSQAMNDITLIYGQDTLHPMSYVFETSYNVAPFETMIVGFDLKNGNKGPEENMQLILLDRVFKNGIIKASFEKSSLKELNNIKVSI
ncbi:MAG: hypothetical protein JST70_13080 [Bacteroidetes bacterium]|jgi:hypothetical protein|nr:hypothetical protein [Bacteroidota bacterium]